MEKDKKRFAAQLESKLTIGGSRKLGAAETTARLSALQKTFDRAGLKNPIKPKAKAEKVP